jgi:hypothetical protein
MNATPMPPLEVRIEQIRAEIDAVIDAKTMAVARQSPGVPLGVIRNLLTARAGACSCAQYLEIAGDGTIEDAGPESSQNGPLEI